ncbi:NADH:ubiquinone oxidoreductase [Wolbachia endosymbiont of Dipetalonema caudispina]|uniref:NADH-ubiquinone oxidoreductase subunit NDUFA12 family protein n=1 Tax=Wolbachia endosymbiont of Dipetalonema caudispina TaxID=1812112 RepID=UPI0015892F23|nr:NADH-ubiquinone oxidoreductase subunit NDUFA12 family protein [Wolbachia endosymbiont of Dipetalonema caudispina]QKX01228.1 NADH:ubiquinone oxidoreductase [Wolbachia endosymbiont of Dipetalonema caudispina]
MLSKIFNAIKYLLQRKAKFIGKDKNGNSYYESKSGKRWVIYSNVPEPTTVSSKWHIWIHYTDNTVPVNDKKRKVKHTHNLTNRKDLYKVKNYYESWKPNNN